jgi:hypothetical protein
MTLQRDNPLAGRIMEKKTPEVSSKKKLCHLRAMVTHE